MNFLFTASGRRVEIIEIFKKELCNDRIFTADIEKTAPALYIGRNSFLVPPLKDPQCLIKLISICRKNEINVIVPLIDPELDFYSKHLNTFLKNNIKILISRPDVISLGRYKYKTYHFLCENNIPTAITYRHKTEIKNFPVIAKPIAGSSSKGILLINNSKQLNRVDNPASYIYQRFIVGEEVTVDAISDKEGNLLASCQRKRLKIREGEVERAVTIFDDKIEYYVKKILQLLRPFGFINIQVIKDKKGALFFTEINLRLGGGSPLTYKSGINIPQILKQLINGKYNIHVPVRAREGVYMLRFDQAIYLEKEDLIYG